PNKLAIFLAGGGACWNGASCDTCAGSGYNSHPFTLAAVSSRQGILDFKNSRNPIRDYTAVLIPVCTADVHLGAVEVDYPTDSSACHPAGKLHIRHLGSKNV